MIDTERIVANTTPLNLDGSHVVYWMTSARRSRWNYALDHAIDLANEANVPLIVVESLALGHRWANDRIHTFVLQGMIDNRKLFESAPLTYVPYVETKQGQASGLLRSFTKGAVAMIIDDYPTYMPRDVANRAMEIGECCVMAIDSNGIIPLRTPQRSFTTAYSFRRYLHKNVLGFLAKPPMAEPLKALNDLPNGKTIVQEACARVNVPITPYEFIWRVAEASREGRDALSYLDIDHEVSPIDSTTGGSVKARIELSKFIVQRLDHYHIDRNHPERHGSSGLSPWLHFGHISSFEIVDAVLKHQKWNPMKVTPPHNGRREGWWGANEGAEAFLDQVITWRELGFIYCHQTPNHAKYETLPDWAKATLNEHSEDERPYLYTFEQLENGETHDPLWNAAQMQLRTEGFIHNYLRMLWGKKVLEWSSDPKTACEWLIRLNDRWALDGRDPNSYTGIFWIFGRFDRGWFERAVFGKIRYMTSASTQRKFKTEDYIQKYADS